MPRTYHAHVAGIDCLRALAVLSVMVYHSQAQWLPGGFTGVDVFFVISGYVVSASLAREDTCSLRQFVINFYARRLIRIYPALLACLLGSFLLSVLFIPASWLSGASWKAGILAFFGLSNFALVWFSDGYFSPRIDYNIFVHTWSLGVEEQFYLVYPLVLFAWLRGRASQQQHWAWLLALLALASLAYATFASAAQPEQAFYLLPSRFWELAVGGLLFQFHSSGWALPRSAPILTAALISGLALIGVGFAAASATRFPVPWALLPVLGSAFALSSAVGFASLPQAPNNSFVWRWAVHLGKMSFSLYLWHWPVFVLLRWTTGLQGLIVPLAWALVFVLAAVSYHCIEVPLRRRLPRLAAETPLKFTRQGLMVICLGAGMALTLWWARPWLSFSQVTRQAEVWYPFANPHGALSSVPAGKDLDGRHLFVIGDSHVAAYESLLRSVSHQTGVTVHAYWEGGCAAPPLDLPSTPSCKLLIERALTDIRRLASPRDLVFLPGLRTPRLSDQWASFDEGAVRAKQLGNDAMLGRAIALLEAEALIGRIEDLGVGVLFELPKPVLRSPPFRCADWFNRSHPICAPGFKVETESLRSLFAPIQVSIESLRSRYPGMLFWDPYPVLCPDRTCSAFDETGAPLYFDGDHLSAHGNDAVLEAFLVTLRGAYGLRSNVSAK